jgi:hypothetical protein
MTHISSFTTNKPNRLPLQLQLKPQAAFLLIQKPTKLGVAHAAGEESSYLLAPYAFSLAQLIARAEVVLGCRIKYWGHFYLLGPV